MLFRENGKLFKIFSEPFTSEELSKNYEGESLLFKESKEPIQNYSAPKTPKEVIQDIQSIVDELNSQ